MNSLSQRDSRWGSIKLGTSDTTIASHGCTITCLSMAADLLPPEVNNRLNSVSGYLQGNLVIWTKVQAAIPWLQFEWRSPASEGYNNDRVKSAIEKNGFCLVEVDGSRIGGTRHWVLYIGNGQMYDPWFGTQKATSYYPATGYAIINKVGEPQSSLYRGLDLSNQESMKICVDDHIKIVEGLLVPIGDLNAEKDKVATYKGKVEELNKQNTSLSQELGDAKADLATTSAALLQTQGSLAAELKSQHDWATVAEEAQDQRDQYRDFTEYCLAQLENDLKLTTTGSATKEERLALIMETTINSVEVDQKYQSQIKALEEENKRLLKNSRPIEQLAVSDIWLILLRRMLIWQK